MSDSSSESGNHVDLVFPAVGPAVPRSHGHALFGALSRIVPWLHGPDAKSAGIGVFPIRGTPGGDGTLLLTPNRSCVRIRTPAQHLPLLLPLAGKPLELDGRRLRLGVPRVAALVPAPALSSPLVLIKLAHAAGKDCITPDLFLAAARRQLEAMGIPAAAPGLQTYPEGPRAGQPRRRVIRVREQTHAGYAMVVRGLTADESIRLQERGLGGRRLMGCGLFLPERVQGGR